MKTMENGVRKRLAWRAIALVSSLAPALVAASCGGTSANSGTDSNTHWLDQCTQDSECGKLSCRCGVCTRECAAASECTDLGSSATCGALAACPTAGTSCVRGSAPQVDAGPAECPSPAIPPGTPCTPVDHPCWSTCTQGYREELTCVNGKWAAGHGLFPCVDAGAETGGGGNGGGGAGNVGGGSGVGGTNDGGSSIYDASCTRDADCVAENVTCCGACGRPTLSDKIALNVGAAGRYQAFACSDPVPCGKCASEPGTITAFCRGGQCVLEDEAQFANCTNDGDCVAEPKDCCFCSAEMAEDSYFVAINRSSGYEGSHCVAPGECSYVCLGLPDAGTVVPRVTAFCGYGYCSLVHPSGPPPK
jgi:hypothetical protein